MFHNLAIFPEDINFGVSGGPAFLTSINKSKSKFEQRNVEWDQPNHTFDVAHAIMDNTKFETVLSFFMAREGKAYSFRFRDWTDYKVVGGVCSRAPSGVPSDTEDGDGVETQFILRKQYTSFGVTKQRLIQRPRIGGSTIYGTQQAFNVYVNAVAYVKDGGGGTGFTLDESTGVVTFNVAPGVGLSITWDGEFDTPVRFAQDRFAATLESFQNHSVSLEVEEVRNEVDA